MDKLDDMTNRFADFCKERDWEKFHNPKDLAMKISIEAAELLELFEWKTTEESFSVIQEKKQDVEAEAADVLCLILEFARISKIDLYDAFRKKMKVNADRYPKDLVIGKNHKYTYYKQ